MWITLLIFLAIGYVIWWLTDFKRQQAKLPALIQLARELGCPITANEFGEILAVPSEKNASLEYEAFRFEKSRLERESPAEFKAIAQSTLQKDSIDRAIPALLEVGQTAERILLGATIKEFHRVNHLNDFPANLIDVSGPTMRFAFKILGLRALHCAHIGQMDECKKWIMAFRKIVDHCHYQPTQLSWLIHVSAVQKYVGTLNAIVKISWNQPGVLDWIQERLDETPGLHSLLECIKAEVAYTLAYTQELKTIGIPIAHEGKPPFPLNLGYFQSGLAIDAYAAIELQGMLDSIKNWPANELDAPKVISLTRPGWMAGKWWIAPSLAWPVYHQGPGSAITSNANRMKVANAGLAIYRYAFEHGHFPKSLPEDLNGEEFVYALRGESFILHKGMISY